MSLAAWLQQSTCELGTWLGRPVVQHFGDPAAEYTALRHGAGMVALGEWTQLEITGRDRLAFLNRLTTNQVDRLQPGEGRETFLTNAKGHVVGYGSLFAQPEAVVLHTAPGQGETLLAHFDYYRIRDVVDFHDRSRAWTTLLVAGPGLPGSIGDAWPDQPLAHRMLDVCGVAVAVRAVDAAGPAYFLSVAAENAEALWFALRAAGVQPCGHAAWDAWRIERGWPIYGRDVSQANLPQEIGRTAQAISFTKGCYLGQETVARLDSRGHVNRLLVGVELAAAALPEESLELLQAGTTVGRITSMAWCCQRQCPIGLGFVRRGCEEPGTALEAGGTPVRVVSLPFIPARTR